MGYTHYFENHKDLDEAAIADLTELVAHGRDGTGTPSVSVDGVVFNGDARRGEDHETFIFPGGCSEERDFAFCKTARKPYDSYVVACLLVIHARKLAKVESDGGPEDWAEGARLFREVLGREPPDLSFLRGE